MKILRTLVQPEKPLFRISHADRLLSIGSCFSENIGKKFSEYKFRININPFGQQYNPVSIANALQRLLHPVAYTERDLAHHNELFHSFDHHGSYSKPNATETLEAINHNLEQSSKDLKQASVLLLTFGTSHVFISKETGKVVSNCHQLPGNVFERRLLTPFEIVSALDEALAAVQAYNPSLKIILTVSPVRYFAFGHYENTVSKGHLFGAVYELQKRHPQFYYFPAYELVIDDLRDYRFFAEDMLHPNHLATEYVWESFRDTLFEAKTIHLLKEIDEILLAANHRPRNPNSKAHRAFVQKTLEKMEMLHNAYELDFEGEEKKLTFDKGGLGIS